MADDVTIFINFGELDLTHWTSEFATTTSSDFGNIYTADFFHVYDVVGDYTVTAYGASETVPGIGVYDVSVIATPSRQRIHRGLSLFVTLTPHTGGGAG